ncbi:hypothetical protein YH63_005235 [Afipia massiliensis]|uniref:Resolvase/invertase-type recombinase catalytic domain-containing protein n=1 Tax=Afipia massiliensis TaxID=211460 RepID=A0A4U6BKW5_9BRAD|nr:hypothetical protein [Afipia massiliensis]TKT70862.1 hypothetical protein YH63_005235 [Afipia massiliensis]
MDEIRRVVVYFRTRPLEPSFSDQALKEQRAAVSHWLADNPASVVAEYSEQEIDGMPRPRLAEAVAKCKTTNARLLIARLESIGSGSSFEPRIATVSVDIAPKTIREIGHIIPCPQNALFGLSLYFPDYRGMRAVPVYLCNNADRQLENLQVTIAGITSKIESLPKVRSLTASQLEESARARDASNCFPHLPAFSSTLIDHYEPMTDGDEIMSYATTFTERNGLRRQMSALIGSGALTARFIKLV